MGKLSLFGGLLAVLALNGCVESDGVISFGPRAPRPPTEDERFEASMVRHHAEVAAEKIRDEEFRAKRDSDEELRKAQDALAVAELKAQHERERLAAADAVRAECELDRPLRSAHSAAADSVFDWKDELDDWRAAHCKFVDLPSEVVTEEGPGGYLASRRIYPYETRCTGKLPAKLADAKKPKFPDVSALERLKNKRCREPDLASGLDVAPAFR